MRILGFSVKWDKLEKPIHTTFRFARKDKDWFEGETVQEVYKPRSKTREILQIATIIKKEPKCVRDIGEDEAIEDGFPSAFSMWLWLGEPDMSKIINKLTLRVHPGGIECSLK